MKILYTITAEVEMSLAWLIGNLKMDVHRENLLKQSVEGNRSHVKRVLFPPHGPVIRSLE